MLPDSRVERVVTLLLTVVLVAALAGVVYIAVSPPETADPYTEFYVLGPNGENASGYPTNLTVDETGTFVVGLTNHEHATTEYTVVATLANRTILDRAVTVADGETWESAVTFRATEPGTHPLRLHLYDGNRTGEPDQTLRLRVVVHPPNGTVRPERTDRTAPSTP